MPNAAMERHSRYDIAVIGGGVVGCAVLRAAALNGLTAVLLERGADILSGASKGNSGILHTGFDAPQGSLELTLMQEGRREYLAVREALGLPLLETDAVLVAWTAEEAAKLPAIVAKAHANGVPDVRPITLDELRQRHPHLSSTAVAALLVPGEHVIDPWSAPLAYAIQAIANGAEILREAEVTRCERLADGWRLHHGRGVVEAGIVAACAGNFGDRVEALAGRGGFTIRPRKGQFVVLDKTASRHMPTIVLPVPTERTKGVVLCPTVYGNVLIGPTAEDQDDREDASVDTAALERLRAEGARMAPALADEPVTAVYAGLRPAANTGGYIIEADRKEGWITVAGIRSTGLTAAPGIAAHVMRLVAEHFMPLNPLNDPVTPRVPNLAEHLPRDHQRPGRGALACLCEMVTEDEIAAALSGPLPAGDLGGLKRRTRALMGRCQGFNCLARVCDLAAGRIPLPALQPLGRAGHG